jgi:hypothetical protein
VQRGNGWIYYGKKKSSSENLMVRLISEFGVGEAH